MKHNLASRMVARSHNEVVAALVDSLDTRRDLEAQRVMRQLASLPSAQRRAAINRLKKTAVDAKHPRRQKWSLQALGELSSRSAMPILVQALRDDRMTVRLHAVRGLSRMKAKSAAIAILDLLKDESGGVRVNAIYALRAIGNSQALRGVSRSLGDSQWYVRQAACDCLLVLAVGGRREKTKLPRATVAKLKTLAASDPRKAVRSAATNTLNDLGER